MLAAKECSTRVFPLCKQLVDLRSCNIRLLSGGVPRKQQLPIPSQTKWSYMKGPTEGVPPLVYLSMGETVDLAATKFPDRQAIVDIDQNKRKTFAELQEEVLNLAAGFTELGLETGDRIGILGPSTYEWYLTQFAAAKAGLVLVNINPAYQHEELKYCINKVGISAMVFNDKFKSQDYYRLLQRIAPELGATQDFLDSKSIPSLRHLILISKEDKTKPGTLSFTDVQSNAGMEAKQSVEILRVSAHSPANIQFTSGTTGQPKGVVLTHYNLVNNAIQIGDRLGYNKCEHRICLSVPLHHCFGNVAGTMCGMLYGATCVIPSPSFNGLACIKAIESENCTSVYGTPTMFIDMLQSVKETGPKLTTVKTGIMAGAPCPKELCEKVLRSLRMENLCVAYGLTETTTAITQGFSSDDIDLMTGTVGYPSNHIEIRIVDENDNIVPVGEPGELHSRGFNTMRGYWADKDKTLETITSDGWLRSGDMAVMQSNGYCRIVGRIKDMIIRGGENIYPREIEEYLHTHPSIQEVHVFGVTDERMGEEVAAWIKLIPGTTLQQDDIRQFCKGNMAHFKIPRYIEFVGHFPTTSTGKVQKFLLRQSMETKLGLEKKIELKQTKEEIVAANTE